MRELRISLAQDDLEESTDFVFPPIDGPSLLSGPVKPISIGELLATMPAKIAMDRLLERFFNEKESAVPSFRQYIQV